MQAAWAEALVRVLDPTCHDEEFTCHTKTQHSQNTYLKYKATWTGRNENRPNMEGTKGIKRQDI